MFEATGMTLSFDGESISRNIAIEAENIKALVFKAQITKVVYTPREYILHQVLGQPFSPTNYLVLRLVLLNQQSLAVFSDVQFESLKQDLSILTSLVSEMSGDTPSNVSLCLHWEGFSMKPCLLTAYESNVDNYGDGYQSCNLTLNFQSDNSPLITWYTPV